MPHDDGDRTSISPYVLGQPCRAVTAASGYPDASLRQRALKRIEHWEEVFQGMLSGTFQSEHGLLCRTFRHGSRLKIQVKPFSTVASHDYRKHGISELQAGEKNEAQ